MRKRALLLAGLLLTAFQALAAPGDVRSGEHEGFTRLVIETAGQAGWALRADGRRMTFDPGDPALRFGIGTVFDRIPRTRLRALSVADGGLALDLGCDCAVRAYAIPGPYVVIDIADPPAEIRGTGAALVPDPVLRLPAGVAGRPLPGAPDRNSLTRPVAAAPQPAFAWRPETGVVAPAARDASGPMPVPTRPDLPEAERRLLEQIGRAATQGLLDVDLDLPPAAPAPGLASPAPGPPTTVRPLANVRATTSIDSAATRILGAPAHGADGDTCLTDAQLDIAGWGDGRPFDEQISAARAALYGEFDQLRPDAARKLARSYLHFGFGAEARQALALVPHAVSDDAVSLALADILDEIETPGPSPFAGQVTCDTSAALWAYMVGDVSVTRAPDLAALQRGFAALPPHLRSHLGPRLARRLASSGDTDTARAVLRLLDRLPPEPGGRTEMVQADLAEMSGDSEAAERHLSDSIAAASDDTPEALIRLVDRHWRTGKPLAPETTDLLASYATQFRGDAVGPALSDAYLRAVALSGATGRALDLLRSGPAKAGGPIESELWVHAANRAEDLEFLALAAARRDGLAPALSPVALRAVAVRLVDLGFAEDALDLLDAAAAPLSDRETRLVRAQAALAARRPGLAEIEATGLAGAEAESIRARARAMQGDHARAQVLFAQSGQAEAALRAAWLAGDPVAPAGDRYGMPAISASAQDTDVPAGPLAEAASLLDGSAALRTVLGQYLGNYPVDVSTR